MAKINTEQMKNARINHSHESNLLHSIITERLKAETKLFQNLAMCEAQLKSFTDEFANNVLTGHTMMEWSDRVEKLNRARDMILRLIQSKTNELMMENKTEKATNVRLS